MRIAAKWWLGLAVAALGACGPDAGVTVPIEAEAKITAAFMASAIEDAANAGRVHNEVQRAILAAILSERARKGKLTSEDIERVSFQACRRSLMASLRRVAECDQIPERIRNRGNRVANGSPRAWTLPLSTSPSSEYLAMLDAIEAAADEGPTAAAFTVATDGIVALAQSTLTDTLEVYSVILVATLSDSSAVYWEEEWPEWETAAVNCEEPEYEEHPACVGPLESQVLPEFSAGRLESPAFPRFLAWYDWICNRRCRKVVMADVAGAIGGGAYWLAVGPAAAGAVAGGTAAASAAMATYEIIDWLKTL